ncbi:MAG: hypothetical protein SVW77_00070 [Candidatus Nanohaloarchaea archaeon]|nr:hypothetical protein [Candidatus Nanohaloarchaea archaeon]
MMELDRLDLAILRTVRDAETPLWKKHIYRTIRGRETLPESVADISVQTLGRRVDALNDADLLVPRIVEPADLNRDLIIAYRLGPDGSAAIEEKQRVLLREFLARRHRPDTGVTTDTDYIADLFADMAGLDEASRDALVELPPAAITALVDAYYLHVDAADVFAGSELDRLQSELDGGRLTPLVEQLAALQEQEI